MSRLQTLLLPNGDYAFIIDGYTEPTVEGCTPDYVRQAEYANWTGFATAAGARGIFITDGEVEIVNPFPFDDDDAPEETEPTRYRVHSVDVENAPEAIQRIIGRLTGDGPFAHLHGEDAAEPDAGDDPRTHGIDPETCGCFNAPSEREQRIGKILGADLAPVAQATVTPLDVDGEPSGESVTVPMSSISVYSDAAVRAAVRRCGAMNGAGQNCSLAHGHDYLHNFAVTGV